MHGCVFRFQRVVKEIAQKSMPDICFQASVIEALQTAPEQYLIEQAPFGLFPAQLPNTLISKYVSMYPDCLKIPISHFSMQNK